MVTDAPLFEEADGDSDEEFVPEVIRKERTRRGKEKYYVKWVGFQDDECTWQSRASIASCVSVIQAWEAKGSLGKKAKGRVATDTSKTISKKRSTTSYDMSRHKRAHGKRVCKPQHTSTS